MFEWDEVKRASNLVKHGVDFAAMDCFDWAGARIIEDRRQDYGESRLRVAGMIGDRLHMAVVTPRSGRLRVISLRKASLRERREWASATS